MYLIVIVSIHPTPLLLQIDGFVRASSGGGFVLVEGIPTASSVGKVKALINAHPSFKHLDQKDMSLRLVAYSGEDIPSPEDETREGNFIDLTFPTWTLAKAIAELQGKVPGTNVSKLFIIVSAPPSSLRPVASTPLDGLKEFVPGSSRGMAEPALIATLMDRIVVGANTMTLPSEFSWPDMSSNVLFVRDFYADLWTSVLQRGVMSPEHTGAVLLGSPGSESLRLIMVTSLLLRYPSFSSRKLVSWSFAMSTSPRPLPVFPSLQSPSRRSVSMPSFEPSRRVGPSCTSREKGGKRSS